METNVVYNWGGEGTAFGDLEGSGPSTANVIGNTYLPGVDSGNWGIRISTNVSPGTLVFVQGNVGPGRETDQGDDWLPVNGDEQYRSMTSTVPPSGITTHTAAMGHDLVLQHAGAVTPARDAVDERVIQSVVDQTGSIIDSQSEVGRLAEPCRRHAAGGRRSRRHAGRLGDVPRPRSERSGRR